MSPSGLVLVAIGGPLLLALLTALLNDLLRRRDKREDWARQDAVAENLRKDNEKLAIQTQQVSDKLDTSTQNTDDMLGKIHTLVNSDMTHVLSSLRASKLAEIALLQRGTPSREDLEAIAALTEQAEELAETLAQRRRAQTAVDAGDSQ